MLHLSYHFIIPAILVAIFYRKRWKYSYFLLMSSMLVDLDHLLANPIYDPTRCSMGFHPLHTVVPIGLYFVLAFLSKTRLIGLGLLIHMVLDSIDCRFTNSIWYML